MARTKNALQAFKLRTGDEFDRDENFEVVWEAWRAVCKGAKDWANGAIAAEKVLDGGTDASPSKLFQCRAV